MKFDSPLMVKALQSLHWHVCHVFNLPKQDVALPGQSYPVALAAVCAGGVLHPNLIKSWVSEWYMFRRAGSSILYGTETRVKFTKALGFLFCRTCN